MASMALALRSTHNRNSPLTVDNCAKPAWPRATNTTLRRPAPTALAGNYVRSSASMLRAAAAKLIMIFIGKIDCLLNYIVYERIACSLSHDYCGNFVHNNPIHSVLVSPKQKTLLHEAYRQFSIFRVARSEGNPFMKRKSL